MGHRGHLKEHYQSLIARLNAGQVGLPEPHDPKIRGAFLELLEIFYTPEHATIASRMPMQPASIHKVAKQVGIPVGELKPKLDAMCDKGLVMDLIHPRTGKVRYFLAPPVVGFFEFSLMRAKDSYPKKRVAEAMQAYMHGDSAFVEDVFGGDTVVGRAIAHEEQLAEDELPDVLRWELATDIVRDARAITVSECYCRHKAEHVGTACDAPREICLSLNSGAEFVARHDFGRAIETSEALELLHQAKAAGLVQIADNVQKRPIYICNCCGCCCGQLKAINDHDLPAVNPSGFVPLTQDEKCKGCSRCSRACPITAIAMRPKRVEAKRKNDMRPDIDLERCIGCAVCAAACKVGAMSMVRREKRTHVPETVIERITRMSIERGRLAHLMFDANESRGHRFLNRIMQSLIKLPPAERLLANEQVRSRFVHWTLRNIRDPTGDR